MNDKNRRLVYADDGSHNKASSNEQVVPGQIKLKIYLEKKGRGGKTVTLISNFPDNQAYFKDLLKKLKNHCSCGGSLKNQTIELQGDHKQKAKAYLEKLGFQVQFAGG